jgi:ABC-type arginine/histidine transport system permease subunit
VLLSEFMIFHSKYTSTIQNGGNLISSQVFQGFVESCRAIGMGQTCIYALRCALYPGLAALREQGD